MTTTTPEIKRSDEVPATSAEAVPSRAAGAAVASATDPVSVTTIHHQPISEWRGCELVDRDGEEIGKLEAVYVDIETDQPMFGTLKEGGIFGRHLTFVPLEGITIGPGSLRVAVSKKQIKDAPNIDTDGTELSGTDELLLYHHYQTDYTPRDTQSGCRLVRR